MPCADLDGECRGTPIVSLMDANAWHVLVLGVQPCTDIDRGPFGSDEQGKDRPSQESPYGDSGMVTATWTGDGGATECNFIVDFPPVFSQPKQLMIGSWRKHRQAHSPFSARMLRAMTSVWVI